MIEELESKIEEFRSVLEVLPTKTVDQRKKRDKIINDAEKDALDMMDLVEDEIDVRLAKFDIYKPNLVIDELKKELKKCSILKEWNVYNTPYEKMHLDYYLHVLHKFYNEDLDGINTVIRKILDAFKTVGVNITKEDFDYNEYASNYIDMIINNKTNEELIEAFEEAYWKYPDIITIIEINFKSIYIRNEKKIYFYYNQRHEEFLKKHTEQELIDLRNDLKSQIDDLEAVDPYILFNRFKNKELLLGDFNEDAIAKKKYIYFKDDGYSLTNLVKFKHSLMEYQLLVKYSFILDDMKERLNNKESYKNVKADAIKDIQKEEAKLRKLYADKNKKVLFFKKKNDEKWLFAYNETIKNLTNMLGNFNEVCFNDTIYNYVPKDASVDIIFDLIVSNYLYFVHEYREHDSDISIDDINKDYEILKGKLENINYSLLNHLALLDEKEIKILIVDKYNLDGFNLQPDTINPDNISRVLEDIDILINYENVIISDLDFEDVRLYDELEKLGVLQTEGETEES